jgi:hypothetical protein
MRVSWHNLYVWNKFQNNQNCYTKSSDDTQITTNKRYATALTNIRVLLNDNTKQKLTRKPAILTTGTYVTAGVRSSQI